MTELVVVGLSHHTAPLEIRERLSVATEAIAEELTTLVRGSVSEGVLVSTCNRVEFYAAANETSPAIAAVRRHLGERGGEEIASLLYTHLGVDAIRHIFRVASSLDSMIVGEPQILGQVKAAYQSAETTGTMGPLLSRCFHHAFAVAKRVRSETGIAEGSVSVSSIAIELASKIFGDLRGRRALLVGAGKMSEAAAKSLAKRGARLFVVNRSAERAAQLARACDGEARGYESLPSELTLADMVISSTASPRFVITQDLMRGVVKARKRKPVFLIDIAVPRDVDPRCGQLPNVFLYDVDDLQKVSAENLDFRRREAEAAEEIVTTETQSFERWRRSLALTPTIVGLRDRFRAVAKAELERTLPRLTGLSDGERQTLERMTDAIVNKLLHSPTTQLKAAANDGNDMALIDTAQRLFELGLDREPEEKSATADAEDERSSDLGPLAPARGKSS